MRQIIQNLKNGDIHLFDVPAPMPGRHEVLIQTSTTLISAGTERMLLEFGNANYLDKARQQPEKVKQVLEKVKTDGLWPTVEAVKSKLDAPMPLGYCNVGRVIAVGPSATCFKVGDRVLSNGPHSEIVSVSENLCAAIPEGVRDEEAVFGVIGAIALQGLRLARPEIGESVVVTGLGLVGLLVAQLLKAQGCRVLGIDYSEERLALAASYGIETCNPGAGQGAVDRALEFSGGQGVDAVLVAASTDSSEPIIEGAQMCRRRGRIVLVGVTGLSLSRDLFYKKELTFQVSCSYGAGRYDDRYERRGQDYPIEFARWTVQRNFETILHLLSSGGLELSRLISHRYPHTEAVAAYQRLREDRSAIGIVMEFPQEQLPDVARLHTVVRPELAAADGLRGAGRVALIGTGNYASRFLAPAITKAGGHVAVLCSKGGLSASQLASKLKSPTVTTEAEVAVGHDSVDTVFIATRNDTHASLVRRALAKGKHVFVEKPLVLFDQELESMIEDYGALQQQDKAPRLMIGFNRRFAPHVVQMREQLAQTNAPSALNYMINAGAIEDDNWVQDRQVGGGRLICEVCHFVDLLRFLVAAPIVDFSARHMKSKTTENFDTLGITLCFEDGSLGTISYFANGHKSVPKERLEVFNGGGIMRMNNFRSIEVSGWPRIKNTAFSMQDKGQNHCVAEFLKCITQGGANPIPVEEIFEVSRVCLALDAQLRNGE